MTRIFLSFSNVDTACINQIRTGLEGQGYAIWQQPDYPGPQSASYPHIIENAIIGSAALIMLWSKNAAQDAWIERQFIFAQDLRKPLFPVLLDSTSLPNTLVATSPLSIQPSCADTVAALVALPNFPPAQSSDPFMTIYEQATHEFIRERKAAIDRAAEMIKQGEHSENLLALLQYLAKHDLIMGVRDRAQEVLDAEAKQALPSPIPQDSRHFFGVRCKNGHISSFDKRLVCSAYKEATRAVKERAGKKLDELWLKCTTCGVDVVAYVDCEDYR